jgi:hypothetical protein
MKGVEEYKSGRDVRRQVQTMMVVAKWGEGTNDRNNETYLGRLQQ